MKSIEERSELVQVNGKRTQPLPSTSKYLEDALLFSKREQELLTEFSIWLPETIFDCHCHANGAAAVGELSKLTLKRVHSTFPDFSIEDSIKVQKHLYPSKNVVALRFANPYKGIDHRKANRYLIENSPPHDMVALCALPDDPNYTVSEIESGKYRAVKAYPFYFEPPAKYIGDYFTPPILQAAEAAGLPIILHVPVPLAQCKTDVIQIARTYPRLRIILAHLGRHRDASKDSAEAYKDTAIYGNIFTDVSMLPSDEILKQVFNAYGPKRVLYGSDEPMNLLRYMKYVHPVLGERFASTYPYHWLDEKQRAEYGHLGKDAIHLHWQVLLALRRAIEDVFGKDTQEVKSLIFYENAKHVF